MVVRKTQRELQNTYPDRFNYVGSKNVQDKLQEIVFMPSTLETIDYAMYNFVSGKMNLSTTTNEGFNKVPIIWASAERSFQIKNRKELRDREETLILPLITIERKSSVKDPNKRGVPYANLYAVDDEKGGTITVARRINQQKTSEFQNNLAARRYGPDGVRSGMESTNSRNMPTQKVVYETITIPLPTWINVTYEISLRTEYQQQMNDLIQPWVTIAGNSTMPPRIEYDNHKFEVFLDGNYANNSNINNMEMAQRNYETTITATVLGYLIGEGDNQEKPRLVKRENAAEFRFQRERVIFGDIPTNIDSRGFYRE
jgi:hypothetical protein